MKMTNDITALTSARRRLAGFTMIELMLVVMIIGIIVAIAVPRMAGRQKRAKVVAASASINSTSTALDAFELDVGRFPSTEEGLQALVARPSTLTPEDEWNGPYMRELPLDPWKRLLIYTYPGDRSVDYDLISMGPDGEEGTEDDVTNFRKEETVR